MKKGNVVSADMHPNLTIGDMDKGDRGFTVPWAYEPKTNILDERFQWIHAQHGTVTMEVICVEKGQYKIKDWGEES